MFITCPFHSLGHFVGWMVLVNLSRHFLYYCDLKHIWRNLALPEESISFLWTWFSSAFSKFSFSLLFRLTKYSNSSEDATSDSDDNRFRPKIRVKKIKLGFFSQKCILTLLRRILFYWRNLFIRWLINEETFDQSQEKSN